VAKIMVTGGTGLIGANICRLHREAGGEVRALARPGSESEPLAALDVELIEGDITSAADVARAADGCEAIINSAALLGGNTQNLEDQKVTNISGASHVYAAAAKEGQRVVAISTTTFLKHDTSLTETSTLADDYGDDSYTVTKRAAYVEAKERASNGEDILVVISGGAFGPCPAVKSSMRMTSFNRALRGALRGKIADYVTYPVPWVSASDVAAASLAAVTRGKAGDTYLAFGAEDAQSTASFLNLACEVADVPYRVAEIVIGPDDPAALERYGPSLVSLAQRTYPVPWFDNRYTRATLGYAPVPLRQAMEDTVAWMRAEHQID
jgi:nucleoside-diphosphate-sugar epimerase